jgi:hypothetical protein
MNIDLTKESFNFLEDFLIGQLEMYEKYDDEFSINYCKKINKLLKEIQFKV